MNVRDGFYELLVNVAYKVPNLKAIPIKQFIHGHCKVLEIELTKNSQDLEKWILLVNNDNYSHAKNKLEKLIDCLLKNKHSLQTMKSSLGRFQAYPEIDGGISANATTKEKVEALSLAPDIQPIPTEVSIQSTISSNHSIWDDHSNKIVTTSVPNPSEITTHSYKSVVINSNMRTSPPSTKQKGTYHQRQRQDLDKSDTESTRLELSVISETKTI